MNDRDYRDIKHQDAVDSLKKAGDRVHLVSKMIRLNSNRYDTDRFLFLVDSSFSTTEYGRDRIRKTGKC